MSFPFSEVCALLSRLEDVESRDPPFLLIAQKQAQLKEVIESWFKSHRRALNGMNEETVVALLSSLLPERRTDRVYWIQETSLVRILSRCLGLSSARAKDLQAYKKHGSGDLGACLERVLKSCGPPAMKRVGLEEVDEMLQTLAGRCRFSNPSVTKPPPGSSQVRDKLIGDIFKRLLPNESKWLVRLILKDLSPVQLDERLILHSYHFLVPDLLRFQDNLESAIRLLKRELSEYPDHPDPRSQRVFRLDAARVLKPAVGVKVGRPSFQKARSIDHCIQMLGGKRWVLERKYDGEYCEIHIDMTSSHDPSHWITIFSKSGKNSTADRRGLHETLFECLRLGKADCKIKSRAILLGELLVYSDAEKCILPFDKIRKHVSRSGRFIGTNEDSQPHDHEHLAIVFFDILVLDDEIVMRKPLEERRRWLREVYTKIPGRAMSAEWKIVDFSQTERARDVLIQQFAASISQRCEGLVLKPCDLPYFSLGSDTDGQYSGYIKVKKDYIDGMGDEADFAVVGGSYNAQHALNCGLPNVKWTEFYLGCLMNKTDLERYDARPQFKVVASVSSDACIPKPILEAANALGKYCAKPYQNDQSPSKFDLQFSIPAKMEVVFDAPFVFEVLGSGFEKPSNCDFLMLRHARVKKLHEDRCFRDCISVYDLAEQAAASRAAPEFERLEMRKLIDRLETKCRKKFERQRTETPRTRTTATPTTATKRNSTKVCSATIASAAIDGSTLIGETSSQSKRPLDVTPCPASKRRRTSTRSSDEASTRSKRSLRTSPLSDITNSAPRPSNGSYANLRERNCEQTMHKPSPCHDQTSSATRPTSKERSKLTNPELQRCTSPTCIFNNSAMFLAPCIASTPYIASDLLSSHATIRVNALAHWDRDSLAHPPLRETVSESQAYEGMRKIVLVESHRRRAVVSIVRQILALNGGKWRERLEVYDWRALEDCISRNLGAGQAKKWFVGATMFHEDVEKAVFVSDVSWLVA